MSDEIQKSLKEREQLLRDKLREFERERDEALALLKSYSTPNASGCESPPNPKEKVQAVDPELCAPCNVIKSYSTPNASGCEGLQNAEEKKSKEKVQALNPEICTPCNPCPPCAPANVETPKAIEEEATTSKEPKFIELHLKSLEDKDKTILERLKLYQEMRRNQIQEIIASATESSQNAVKDMVSASCNCIVNEPNPIC